MRVFAGLLIMALLGSGTYFVVRGNRKCSACQASPSKGTTVVSLPGSAPPPIVGDSAEVVRDFKRIYQALVAFREEHRRFATFRELLDMSWPNAPQPRIDVQDLEYSGAKRPEYLTSRPYIRGPEYSVHYLARRYNGEARPLFPKSGERDIWVSSWHFVRSRLVKSPRGSVPENYGVFIGLFSDGEVAVVPAAKMWAVPRSSQSWWAGFPGEAGLPKNVLPYNEAQGQSLDVTVRK